MTNDPHILTAEGPVLSTLERDGSRRWLSPKLARGHFWSRRRVVAYAPLPSLTRRARGGGTRTRNLPTGTIKAGAVIVRVGKGALSIELLA